MLTACEGLCQLDKRFFFCLLKAFLPTQVLIERLKKYNKGGYKGV